MRASLSCPSHSVPDVADDGITELQEKVLLLLEDAGLRDPATNDQILALIDAAEKSLWETKPPAKRVIDLTCPGGSPGALMGYTRQFARELDWSPQEVAGLLDEMMGGDYEHAVQVFDDAFGKFVTVLR